MTRPRNLSLTNCKAAFMQCSGAPSCTHHKEERVAVLHNNLLKDHITSLSKVRWESPLTEGKFPASFMNA